MQERQRAQRVASKKPLGQKEKRGPDRPRKRLREEAPPECHQEGEVCSSTKATSARSENGMKIRRMYSEKQKVRVVEYTRHHGVRPAMRHFGIHRRNIQRWMEEYRDYHFNAKKVRQAKAGKRHRKGQGRKLSYPVEVDQEILVWLYVRGNVI